MASQAEPPVASIRVDDHHVTLGNVLGHLAEVGVRLKRFFIAVHADVAHARGGDHAQHTVDKAEARAQDGDDQANFLPASVGRPSRRWGS